MNKKKTQVDFSDIDCSVLHWPCQGAEKAIMEFRAYRVVGIPTETTPITWGYDAMNDSPDIESALVFMSGRVKWDGCSDINFDEQDEGSLHFCSKYGARIVGELISRIYDIAAQSIPRWDERQGRSGFMKRENSPVTIKDTEAFYSNLPEVARSPYAWACLSPEERATFQEEMLLLIEKHVEFVGQGEKEESVSKVVIGFGDRDVEPFGSPMRTSAEVAKGVLESAAKEVEYTVYKFEVGEDKASDCFREPVDYLSSALGVPVEDIAAYQVCMCRGKAEGTVTVARPKDSPSS